MATPAELPHIETGKSTITPEDIDAAARVLKATKAGEQPSRKDALRLRLLMPQGTRTGPLVEIAEAIVDRETKNGQPKPASTNI